LLYQNIADEQLSASDASSVIISQMKAFNITADKSTHIIDSINAVSNNFAVSSGDIGRGLTSAGAALSTYGNSFEQTIG
jgi:TP901 family phage tail tape measure protein